MFHVNNDQLCPACKASKIAEASTHSSAFLKIRKYTPGGICARALYTRICNSILFFSCSVTMFVVSCRKLPGTYEPSTSFGDCLLRDGVEDIGDPAREVDVKKLLVPLLFTDVRLNFDKVRVGFAL